jgi:hypothetical protein
MSIEKKAQAKPKKKQQCTSKTKNMHPSYPKADALYELMHA